jgi:hypothetical protein
VDGHCSSCPAGQGFCGPGGCKPIGTSPSNCGACGTQCLQGEICRNGQCQASQCTDNSTCPNLYDSTAGYREKCVNGSCAPTTVDACHQEPSCTLSGHNPYGSTPVCTCSVQADGSRNTNVACACDGNRPTDVMGCSCCPIGYQYDSVKDVCWK